MMIFWMISALMLVVAMLFVVLPLWRGKTTISQVRRDAANLEIYRDQIAEMDTDLRNGLLTQEMHEQGKSEIQSRLLDEVGKDAEKTLNANRASSKMLSIGLMVLMPLLAGGLYWKVGNQHAMKAQSAETQDSGLLQTESELNALEAELAANPQNAEGWYQLARSYTGLERYQQAAIAYDKLTRQVPNEAQLWVDYADVLAMASGQSLKGAPTKLLDKALELDPDNMKALALSGSAAMERGDYAATIKHWERLQKMLPPGNENIAMIESGISRARELLAQSGGKIAKSKAVNTAEKVGSSISGMVTLSDSLKSKVSPEDTLFVLARAAEGPKMPLAILRKQVKDLPLQFTLDDSMAMTPQMRLSSFDQIVIVAKISKTGNAVTQSGDLQGMSPVLKPGTRSVKLQIDTVAP